MKTKHAVSGLLAVILGLGLSAACKSVADDESSGHLFIHFSDSRYLHTRSPEGGIPDTCDFLLSVTSSDGTPVYEGKYGDSPESLLVRSGTYLISVRSSQFDAPAFSSPQYGDDQCVTVPEGGDVEVILTCAQVNSGLRLRFHESFLSAYPGSGVAVESDGKSLDYSYGERRVAYFLPGPVRVRAANDVSKEFFVRELKPREVLTVNLSAPESGSGGEISVDIDTTRNWKDEDIIAGGGGKGETLSSAMDVATARASAGAAGVWVYGYIAGCFKTSSSPSFEPPFPSSTNLLIASRPSVTDKESCLSVELKKGSMRDALNLMDNPSNDGRKIWLKGDIADKYFGIPGLKAITAWELDE